MFTDIKKGDMIVNEYLQKIKSIVDQLASVGHSIFVEDHIDAIFEGLPLIYDIFVVSVNSRLDAYTVAEIESLLLVQETHIEKHHKEPDSNINSTSHVNLASQVMNLINVATYGYYQNKRFNNLQNLGFGNTRGSTSACNSPSPFSGATRGGRDSSSSFPTSKKGQRS